MPTIVNNGDPRRLVLVSALGTGRYEPTRYRLDGVDLQEERFIQVSLAQHLLSTARTPVVVLVLATPEADERHGEALREGLGGLSADTVWVSIPRPASEEAFTQLRRALAAHLRPDDTVVLDITHGFRATAPLLLAAVEELEADGRIDELRQVTYGMYDPDGSAIWDVTPAIATREAVRARRDAEEHGFLLGVADLLPRRSPAKKLCTDWQRAQDLLQMEHLCELAPRLVEALDDWVATQRERTLMAPACDAVKAVSNTLRSVARAPEGAARQLALASYLLEVGRQAASVLVAREAAVTAVQEMVQLRCPEAPFAKRPEWEKVFGLFGLNCVPNAQPSLPLYCWVVEHLEDDRFAGWDVLAGAVQLRNHVAHCWASHGHGSFRKKAVRTYISRVKALLEGAHAAADPR